MFGVSLEFDSPWGCVLLTRAPANATILTGGRTGLETTADTGAGFQEADGYRRVIASCELRQPSNRNSGRARVSATVPGGRTSRSSSACTRRVTSSRRSARGHWGRRAGGARLACGPLVAQAPPLAVDIVVLDKAGKVPNSLAPSDLAVTLGGQARPVLWVRRVSRGPGALADASAKRAAAQPDTAFGAERSRTVVVAVDEQSFPAGGERPAIQVVAALLDRLGMNDRVALVRLPLASGPALAFTTDQPVVRKAIERIAGRLVADERPQDGITPTGATSEAT